MANQPILSIIGRNVIGCEGLRRILLERDFKIQCCATYSSALDLASWINDAGEILIVDGASVAQAMEISSKVRRELPLARIVILCDEFDLESLKRAFALPIDGVLPAEMRPDALAAALRLIAAGGKVMPSELPELLIAEYGRSAAFLKTGDTPQVKLTAADWDVLRLVASGHTNKEIGEAIDFSEASVKAQIKTILRKLNVGNRTQAATWAYWHGLANGEGNGSAGP